MPEVTGGAANRLREDKILSICISIKLGSPESGNKIASSDGVSGCGIPGQDGGSHEDKKLGLRDPGTRECWGGGDGRVVMVGCRRGSSGGIQAQGSEERTQLEAERCIGSSTGKDRNKAHSQDRGRHVCLPVFRCPLLEIPLKTVTEISRDDHKDYAVSRWLMNAATQRSSEHHRFGSRAHREDLEASLGLALLSTIASLFPSHRKLSG